MFIYFWRFVLNDFTFVFLYSFLGLLLRAFVFPNMKYDLNRIADFLEDDFNRIMDFVINFWVSFQIFINVLHMFLDNLPWRQLNRLNGIIIWNKIVRIF